MKATEYVWADSEAEALQYLRQRQSCEDREIVRGQAMPGETEYEIEINVRRVEHHGQD